MLLLNTVLIFFIQIHFRSGVGGNGKVTEEASQLINELDRLMNDIKEQTTTLEACLSQIDQYQHVSRLSFLPSRLCLEPAQFAIL